MSVDFPRAWQISQEVNPEDHHSGCSFNVTDGMTLCDCDILMKHPEYIDEVLQGKDGVPCKRQPKGDE